MDDLVAGVLAGKPRAIARLITQVENSDAAAETAVTALYPHTGQAHVIGITGPPGSGKSSLVNEIAKQLRQREVRLGIIAVDPSSPFTGGAVLGDRVRMRDLAGDRGVFIRSLASRGSLGGLSRATNAVVKILDAAGFDAILIETVGAGQAEVEIANAAHTTLVVEAPGMGDDVQTIKAGILEIADILVVNKADRPGAKRTVQGLNTMLQLGHSTNVRHGFATHHQQVLVPDIGVNNDVAQVWQIMVQETVATEGTGVPELVDRVMAHRTYLQESGEWLAQEQARSSWEIEQLLYFRLLAQLQTAVPSLNRESLVTAVAKRELDPYTAVNQLFNQIIA